MIQSERSAAIFLRKVSVRPPGGWAMRAASIEKPVGNISGRIARAPARGALQAFFDPAVVLGDVLPGDVELDERDLHPTFVSRSDEGIRSFSRRETASRSVSSFLQNANRA